MTTTQLQLRRDTTANIAAVVPAQGEPVFDVTLSRLIIGDGSTAGGNSPVPAPTRQVLTTSGTYTTPAGARCLVVRMYGGGGGGGGSGTSGSLGGGAGGDTIFSGIHAAGGSAATGIPGAAGGANGTGAASVRLPGAPGQNSSSLPISATNATVLGGNGGGNGGGVAAAGAAGGAAKANSGGGGASASLASAAFATINSDSWYGAGGQGEYAELIILGPTATYSFTIGAGGTGGSAGSSGFAGGNGGSGLIVVDESY